MYLICAAEDIFIITNLLFQSTSVETITDLDVELRPCERHMHFYRRRFSVPMSRSPMRSKSRSRPMPASDHNGWLFALLHSVNAFENPGTISILLCCWAFYTGCGILCIRIE